MSPRRLHGWSPEERHEHFDADGNLTGFTVVTREPEWTDYDRERLLALAQYEAGLCDCGAHRDRMTPGEHFYAIEEQKCPVCANVERYQRIQSVADRRESEQLGEDAPPGVGRAADGRKIYVRQQSPFEVEERRRKR